MNFTFRKKLILAFSGLCLLILLQSAVGYGLTQRAQFFESRSLIAQQLLVAYTNIGADKQRLKVWYAELLLTGKASESSRNALIATINDSIQTVRNLLPIQQADFPHEPLTALVNDQRLEGSEVLDIIEKNFATFQIRVSQNDWALANIEKQQVWREMLSTFDISRGIDMKLLIAQAIEQQSRIGNQATLDANAAVKLINQIRFFLLILTVGTAFTLAWYFVKHLTQPITDLMLGTDQIQKASPQATSAVNVPIRGTDEFGSLARNFNHMAQEIHDRRLNDRNKNEQLELAVGERTKQLVAANGELLGEELRRRQFFSDLSHELKTPTTVILGEAEIALRGSEKSAVEYRLSLTNIANTTRELAQRINTLLLLSQQKLDPVDLQAIDQPLLPIVDAALIQARVLAKDTKVSIEPLQLVLADVSEIIGAAPHLTTDAGRLQQLLMVFYDNAIRYTPHLGTVKTTLTITPTSKTIVIEDTGIGIAADEHRELFARHFRGSKARTMRSDGAGLGLNIAKTLAKALQFEVTIDNTPTNSGCLVTLKNISG